MAPRLPAIAIGGLALVLASAAVAQSADDTLVERGRYLAAVGDCAGCHAAPGQTALAGGREIETPFGMMLSSNITPDPETGIGRWSDEEFANAVQRGKAPHGKLYPA